MPNSSATDPEPHAAGQGEGEPEHFVFELPARLEYRDAARAFLAHICEQLIRANRLPSDVGLRVISAFVEGFNNAVIHGRRVDADERGTLREGSMVRVGLTVTDTYLEVRLTDRGRAFAPEKVPEPDLDALPEGGLGLFIMRNFMDQVRYERNGDENVLIMTKQIERAEPRDPAAEPTRTREE